MSVLHMAYRANEKIVRRAKNIQRKRRDKKDIYALMVNDGRVEEEQKKRIRDFWKPYGKTDPIFQKYYYEKNGQVDFRYIPDDLYYTETQYYYNKMPAAEIVDHKGYYESLFPDIKHPVTISKRLNGYWIVDNKCVSIDKVVERLCSSDIIFIKPATGSNGGGGIKILEGNSVSLDGFRNAIGNIRGDIVVQQKAEQCPELNAIYRHSVNTMRIMSIIDKTGEVIILSRSLRMGTGGGRLDNAHSGGIFIGLDENGRLKEYALTLNGTKYYKHPDTGIIFKNVVLPSVSLVDEAVKKCAIRVPAFRIVAWDIIVDSKYEPTMIEANFFCAGLDVPQLNNGPLFGDRTKEFLDEVYGQQ